MDYGLFSMPLHPPERDKTEGYELDIETFVLADKLGYSEGWMGEHFTIPWESIPAADLFIANVLPRTERIKLGTGVVLLPMHNPVDTAMRIAFLDHLARGRFYFGIGSGGAPTDFEMWGIDNQAGEHRERTREAIDIILRVWEAQEPFTYQGKFWNVTIPKPRPEVPLAHHIRPYQQPHPPIAVAGLHRNSETLTMAGERGWIPMSINYLPARNLVSHWETVEDGARRQGKVADRRQWRIAREVYVAETDAKAREEVLNGPMRRGFEEYMRGILSSLGSVDLYKTDPDMPDEAVDTEYVTDNIWIVGSPDTVTEKIRTLYNDVGGFGTILQIAYDWEPWDRWLNCMDLFANRVMPNLKDLVPSPEDASVAVTA
ncbi:MAG: LLM class flavin-dependent oxidoreductase [Dehalococcoidia bacterium]|nr:LLM class flavin-dependent oxidoreductase [Dehalococcoidia bacterium]